MLVLELAFRGLLQGAGFGLAGLGFAIIFRTAKELHFAFGVTIAIGGYAAYTFAGAGLPVLVAFVLAVALCALFGVAVRSLAYRRLTHDAVLLFSFGLTIVLENVIQIIYGPADLVLRNEALNEIVQLSPGTGFVAQLVHLLGPVVLLVAFLATGGLLYRTKTGIGLVAVIRDQEMAELVGVRVERMKLLAYAIGSGLAGLAGVLTVVGSGVRPTLGFQLILYGFIATILAGDRFVNAAIWGLLLGVGQSITAVWLPAHYGTLIVFIGLITFLVYRMRSLPRFAL